MDNKQAVNSCKKTSIGGQALIEGIMMRGPKKTAMAVRHTSGEMKIKIWDTETKPTPKFFKLPFVRGVYNFIASMKVGYKALMDSADMSGLEEEIAEEAPKSDENQSEAAPDSRKKKDEGKTSALMNVLMVIASVLGVALSIFLFMYLPAKLYSLLAYFFPSLEGSRFIRSLFEGILRIAIFVGYMAAMALLKDIRRTFMYHGAEHKSIFCYEAGLELTVENVKKMKRFHPRCGTSFMILMLIVGIFISMFIPADLTPILRTAIKLLTIPLVMGIGYELIRLAGRHDNAFTRFISKPGMWLQHISVLEPDDGMIECAIKALTLVIPEDESDNW